MDLSIYFEEAAQVLVAFIIGAIIGLEREFKSKAAGFRTMILICVGSCVYTILSKDVTFGNTDRIASNIVTGIGFIGAGVIFKEGISVNGLTTAALIWITAALGMAIGYHNYPLTILVAGMVIVVLFLLEPLQRYILRFHKVKDYRIRTVPSGIHVQQEIETFFSKNDIKFECVKALKDNNEAVFLYRISAPNKNYDMVDQFLINNAGIKGYEA